MNLRPFILFFQMNWHTSLVCQLRNARIGRYTLLNSVFRLDVVVSQNPVDLAEVVDYSLGVTEMSPDSLYWVRVHS